MDITILKSIPLFSELSDQELREIQRVAVRQTFKKDNMILIEEEVDTHKLLQMNDKIVVLRDSFIS